MENFKILAIAKTISQNEQAGNTLEVLTGVKQLVELMYINELSFEDLYNMGVETSQIIERFENVKYEIKMDIDWDTYKLIKY